MLSLPGINGAIPHPALDIPDISGVESVAGRYVVFTTVLDAVRIVPKHECWLASNRSVEAASLLGNYRVRLEAAEIAVKTAKDVQTARAQGRRR